MHLEGKVLHVSFPLCGCLLAWWYLLMGGSYGCCTPGRSLSHLTSCHCPHVWVPDNISPTFPLQISLIPGTDHSANWWIAPVLACRLPISDMENLLSLGHHGFQQARILQVATRSWMISSEYLIVCAKVLIVKSHGGMYITSEKWWRVRERPDKTSVWGISKLFVSGSLVQGLVHWYFTTIPGTHPHLL